MYTSIRKFDYSLLAFLTETDKVALFGFGVNPGLWKELKSEIYKNSTMRCTSLHMQMAITSVYIESRTLKFCTNGFLLHLLFQFILMFHAENDPYDPWRKNKGFSSMS